MNSFAIKLTKIAAAAAVLGGCAAQIAANQQSVGVSNEVIAAQRAVLAESVGTADAGPQAPRDISSRTGTSSISFPTAPLYTSMNLCNIHFHESAEHRGGEFTKYAGNGDGKGFGTGFKYSGQLTAAELAPIGVKVGGSTHGDLVPGDTIEVHYVHSTDPITPGPTLGACLSSADSKPFLRVETQVMVLVNDPNALDFNELAKVERVGGFHQAPNIPSNAGVPVQYAGSTTGPKFNEKPSPFQVTWSVRPKVVKVNILSVGTWLSGNVFEETYAHGVRNLVVNQALLSRF